MTPVAPLREKWERPEKWNPRGCPGLLRALQGLHSVSSSALGRTRELGKKILRKLFILHYSQSKDKPKLVMKWPMMVKEKAPVHNKRSLILVCSLLTVSRTNHRMRAWES